MITAKVFTPALRVVLLWALASIEAKGATIVLNQNTVIDSAQSFPNDSLIIADGPSGPSHVTLVSGGAVGNGGPAGNVRITQNSTFEMLGGFVSNRVAAIENSTFVYRGGVIGSFADASTMFDIIGNATLHYYGIPTSGVVGLGGFGTANFYGRNLSLTGNIISGIDSSGDQVAGELTINGPNVTIVLHQIPEPSALVVAFALVSSCLSRRLALAA